MVGNQQLSINKGTRTPYITLLSVLSAISVVCLHTNGCFWNFSTAGYWFSANIIECVFYFAVPIFFMISGATLINYQERYSTREFFARRFKKTLVPFVSWSMIGLVCQLLLKNVHIGEINLPFIINGILGTSIIGIYWFFTALFCIYLCIPLFAAVEKDKRKKIFTYLAIAGFTINFLVPFIKNVFDIHLNWPFSVSVASGSLIYVIIGYLLNNCDIPKKAAIVIYILSICGFMAHIIGTYTLSMTAGSIVRTYKGYNNVPCILYSTGIFLALKKCGNHIMESPLGKGIRFLGNYTFGIYLIHLYIMYLVRDGLFVRILHIAPTSIVYRLGSPLIIIPVAVFAIYIIRKIPIVKKIVPQ